MKKSEIEQKLLKDTIQHKLRGGPSAPDTISSLTIEKLAEEISIYHQELVFQNEELLRQTAELKAMQKTYRELFNDAPIGYIVLDDIGKIIAANTMFSKLVRMELAQIRTLYLTSLIHPESQDAFYFSMRELNRRGYAEIPELHLTGSEGTVRTRCSINRHTSEGEEQIRIAFVDLTQFQTVEEARQEAERKKQLDLMNLMFQQSLAGSFFMMLDEPMIWNDSIDKEKALDYIFEHQRITKVNKAMLDQYRANEKEFIGKTPAMLFQRDLEQGRQVWKHLFDAGRLHFDTDERRMDGSPMTVLGDYICLYDSEGRITGHFGIQLDISDRKQAEEKAEQYGQALQEKSQLLQMILDNVPGGIWLNNRESETIFMNKFGQDHFNLSEQELAICRQTDCDLVGKDGPQRYEEVVTFKDNKQHIVETVKTKVTRSDGSLLGILAIGLDVTKRKEAEAARQKAEQAAREEREQLQLILQTIPAPVMVIRPADKVTVYCNETFCELSGYTADEVIGRNHRELDVYTDRSRLDSMLALTLQQGYCENFEMTYRGKGRQPINALVATRVLSISGEPHILAIVRDITAEKAAVQALQQSEARYRMLAENMKDVIWTFDPETRRFLYVSPSVYALQGFTPEEAMARTIDDDLMMESSAYVLRKLESVETAYAAGQPILDQYDELELRCKDGSTVWTEVITSYYMNPQTGRMETSGVTRDISARKQAEIKLLQSEAKYRTLLEHATQAIVVIQKGLFKFCNPHTVKMTGYEHKEIIDSPFITHIHPQDVAMVQANYIKCLAGEEVPLYEFRIFHKNGSLCWLEVSSLPIEWEGETAALSFISDLTERKLKEQEILYHSYHDQLTGLYNRRYYEDALKRLNEQEYLPFSIILADVNGLKLTNDAFGHLAGDRLLQTIANAIKSVCRCDDVAARIGGDEFALLLPNTSAYDAEQVAARLREAIGKSQSGHVVVSLSLGWATKSSLLEQNHHSYMRAEEMMYSNKLTESPKMKRATLDQIIRNLYERSSHEEQHATRVSLWCEQMGIALGLESQQVSELRIAGLHHDIGKIGVNAAGLYGQELLNEADRLDSVRHPEIGYAILSALPEYGEIARIVLAHHEHWDGSGYPKGLRGEGIPRASRIIHVIEAYDTMVSSLNYHEPYDEEKAIQELQRLAGSQFDPAVVEAFCKHVWPYARV